jgi:hypothetical protein
MTRHIVVYFAVMLCLFGQSAVAAEKRPAPKAVEIVHIAPTPKQLPAPGELMSLNVSLKNTKDSERKLRAFVVRDGQMLDLTIPSGQYNQQEEPYYEVPLYAPEGELLYLFMLYNPDGSITRSDRYYVRRSCLPDTTLALGKIDKTLKPDAQLVELVAQAERLKRDIKSYETVLLLLKDLKKLIGER